MSYNDDFGFKPDPTLMFEVPEDGEYRFRVFDAIYRGREDFVYRISIGELPLVTSIFPRPLWDGIEVIRRLIHAFYDPTFSFHAFVERYPDQRVALIDCLVGDVVEKDMSGFLAALAEMTPVPPPVTHVPDEIQV